MFYLLCYNAMNVLISEGVEKLVGVYKERPNFADQDAQEDAKQRLYQVKCVSKAVSGTVCV
jgi:hypothetical protein